MKIKGVVTRRDADTFTVRDMNGVDTIVRLDDRTSVKTKGGFLRSGTNYAQTNILRGLNLEVEGRGNGQVSWLPRKFVSTNRILRVARAVESRAAPLEERATNTETKLPRLKQTRSVFPANWKNWRLFPTPPEAVRKLHRKLLTRRSPA